MAFCCVGIAALSLARLKGRGLQCGKRASQVRRLVDADGKDVWESPEKEMGMGLLM